jgi:predicted Zn-dependent peptidase
MYRHYTLPNGLNVFLMPRQNTSDVAFVVGGKLGSRYETEKNNGHLHLMEHAVLEGSRLYPNEQKLQMVLDYMAGDINADIGKDLIMFHLTIAASHLKRGFSLIADSTLTPFLDPAKIHKEKGAVIEELMAFLDDNESLADWLADQMVFKGHPLANDPLGSEKNVRQTSASQVEKAWKRLINPKRLAVAVVGKFTLDDMKRKIEDQFGELKPRNFPKPAGFHPTQSERRLEVIKKDCEQVYFQIGFPTFNGDNKDYFTLSLLNNILGGRYSSRIYHEARGSRGLVYHIGSAMWHHEDIGSLQIISSCQPKSLLEVVELVMNELRRLKTEKVTKEKIQVDSNLTVTQLDVSKNYLRGWSARKFRDDLYAAKFYVSQILRYGRIVPVQTYKTSINRVTATMIQRLAQRLFVTEKINMAMVGPVDDTLKKVIETKLVL